MTDARNGGPLFVVGCPRSGTTLVKTMLGAVDGTYLLPAEFQILGPFLRAAAAGDSPQDLRRRIERSAFGHHTSTSGPDSAKIDFAIATQGDAARAFENLVRLFAKEQGIDEVRFWGDKTPENIFELELLVSTWPDARIVVVVRDPRDVVASMRAAWGRSYLRSSVIWRDAERAVAHFEKAHAPDGILRVRYEDVTADPQHELHRLANWLGTSCDSHRLEHLSTQEQWGRARESRGVRMVDLGGRESLTARQLKLIESICYAEMMEEGYRPERASRPWNPHAFFILYAQLMDAGHALRAYARGRGWRAAAKYKMRQWFGARL